MSKLLKKQILGSLQHRLEKLEGYVLVNYQGLNSAQSYDLRKTLRVSGVRMSVVPNRLAARVLDRWKGEHSKGFRQLLRGPTALVFGEDGAITASKAIAQWKKKNKDLLPIKGGVLNDTILPPSAVDALAKIPDQKQLLAQVAGTLQAPLTRLAGATQGPLRKLAYALDAYKRKLEEAAPAVTPEPVSSEGVAPAAGASPAEAGAASPEAAVTPAAATPEAPGAADTGAGEAKEAPQG